MTKPTATFSGPDICQLPAREVVDLLKNKKVSPKELLDASYERIAQVEPAVNATVTQCPERAYASLENLEANAKKHGSHEAWLGGLPIAIKDLTVVSGVKTTFGSYGLRDFVPEESDPLVERLEDRGGVVVGKTNTPEFGQQAIYLDDRYDLVDFDPQNVATWSPGMEQLANDGIDQIKLRVAYHNKRALALYQETGFKITGYNMSKKLKV